MRAVKRPRGAKLSSTQKAAAVACGAFALIAVYYARAGESAPAAVAALVAAGCALMLLPGRPGG